MQRVWFWCYLLVSLTLCFLFLYAPGRDRLCLETEQIGNVTISQMGQQREQLEGANRNVSATMAIALQAKTILGDM